MGEPSNASMLSIMILLPSTDLILHTEYPIRFGRTGDRVANTPVIGFALSPRGWTLRVDLLSGESFRSNQ